MVSIEVPKVITYSQVCSFRNCRRLWYLRNVESLVPRRVSAPLHFGGLVHWGLEQRFKGVPQEEIYASIQERCHADVERMQVFGRSYDLYVIAALEAYHRKWPRSTDGWEVTHVEQEWRAPLVNPDTGRASRKLCLGGKVDLIVQRPNGDHWLVEHKTISNITASQYRQDRLWTNFQGAWYMEHASRALGIEIRGVIFDIIQKSNLRQRKKSRSRKVDETDKEFLARLLVDHARPDRFERSDITYDDDRTLQMNREVWALRGDMLAAARNGKKAFYQNPDWCFKWNSACRYYKICSSKNSQFVIDSDYAKKPSNSELTQGDGNGDTTNETDQTIHRPGQADSVPVRTS